MRLSDGTLLILRTVGCHQGEARQSVLQQAWLHYDRAGTLEEWFVLAAVSKVMVFEHTIKDIMILGDRCGAQGLLRANQLDGFIVCIWHSHLFI